MTRLAVRGRFCEQKSEDRARLWMTERRDFLAAVGTTKLNHLEENLGAVAVDLTPGELKEIRTTLSQIKVQGVRTPESAPTDP